MLHDAISVRREVDGFEPGKCTVAYKPCMYDV